MFSTQEFEDKGLALLRETTRRLSLPVMFEPSVRLSDGRMDRLRGLFSLPVGALGDSASVFTEQQCRAMGAPEDTLRAILSLLPAAAFIHFGFESALGLITAKCYLELPPGQPDDDRSDSADTVRMSSRSPVRFLGYKWTPGPSRKSVVTRYRELPTESVAAAFRCLADAGGPQVGSWLAATADAVDGSSAGRSIRLLEIDEEGSPRRSFDVNIYDLDLPLATPELDWRNLTAEMGISDRAVSAWLDECGHLTLGHLATGVNRNGDAFVTVYYGACRLGH